MWKPDNFFKTQWKYPIHSKWQGQYDVVQLVAFILSLLLHFLLQSNVSSSLSRRWYYANLSTSSNLAIYLLTDIGPTLDLSQDWAEYPSLDRLFCCEK